MNFLDALYVPVLAGDRSVSALRGVLSNFQLPVSSSLHLKAYPGLSAERRAGRDAGQVDGPGEPSDSGAESWGLASC